MSYEYNKFYYKPLPEYLEVDSSDIEGSGVFALEDIDADLDIGMTHIKVPIIQGYIHTPIVTGKRLVIEFIVFIAHG